MTEDTNPETMPPEDTRTPMERAVAGGYKEPPAPSREERSAALVASMEHAMKHSAALTVDMLTEMRDLLGVAVSATDDAGEGT